jgi:hypothetical protein
MKRTVLSITSLLLLLALVFSFGACQAPADPWADAIYTEDTTLGEGGTQFTFEVVCGENKVTFTIHTDEEILGDALVRLDLLEGEEGAYGLYVKRVNGVLSDYDVDASYWSLLVNGEYAMVGVDSTPVEAGAVYCFMRVK